MSEADLKRAVVGYLTSMKSMGKILSYRMNSGKFVAENKNGSKRMIEGCEKGTADFQVLAHGRQVVANGVEYEMVPIASLRVIWMELKSATGKQSPAQKVFQKEVVSFGCEYYIVRDIEDIEELLK